MSGRFPTGLLMALWCGGRLFGDACLAYEPKTVNLTGTLVSHRGLRGWWGLKLDRPICMTKGDPADPFMFPYQGVLEVQLLLNGQSEFDHYRNLLGEPVSATGKLTPRVNGHHETEVLIFVERIVATNATTAPFPTSARTEPGPLLTPPSYFASVTVLPHPVSRVIKQAWDKDPKEFFAESDRYISHFFKPSMDLMWVKCIDGYAISAPKSSTNSSIFQMDPDDPKNTVWGVAVSDSERTNIVVRCVRVSR